MISMKIGELVHNKKIAFSEGWNPSLIYGISSLNRIFDGFAMDCWFLLFRSLEISYRQKNEFVASLTTCWRQMISVTTC